jgi:cytochrome c553
MVCPDQPAILVTLLKYRRRTGIGTVRTVADCLASGGLDCAKPRQQQAASPRGSSMRPVFYRVTLVLLVCTSEAAFAANPNNGSTLAQRWCAACHIVSGGQSKGTDIAPSFASIAERSDFNAEKLVYFLLEPHPKMPNMSLSRDEAKDLSAYIGEQRR